MSVALQRQLARRRMAQRVDQLLPLELSKETPRLASTPAPIGKYGLWHVKGMEFPPYFQNVRNALIRNGHSVSEASQITWGAIRKWARGAKTGGEKGHIHPEVIEAARQALAGIAKDSQRAHAQRAAHTHGNVLDQLVLREFARSQRVLVIDLADPYHSSSGQFTSAGNQGSASPKVKPQSPKGATQANQPGITPQQRQQYLKQAAADSAKAQMLRAEAAKINKQIAALTTLIATQQKYLATAGTGATAAGAGTNTGYGAGTATAAGAGTQTGQVAGPGGTPIAATGTTAATTAAGTTTTSWTPTVTQQMLAANQAQLKQLTQTRDNLLRQAAVLDKQAQVYTQLANG